MFPPLSEPVLETSISRRRVPGPKAYRASKRLCHRKLSWRRDVLILSYRNVGSVAEMRAKNEGWQVSAKALGESVHQDHPADKLVRRDRHGFPAVRTFDAIVLPAERHAPIIGCDQPAVRDGNGGASGLGGQLPVIVIAARAAGIGPSLPSATNFAVMHNAVFATRIRQV